jgi:hypothetical protein
MDDDQLRQTLSRLPTPEPPHGLAARIVRQAVAQPQRLTGSGRLRRALEDWRYGWPVKLASLALCAILGLLAGQFATPADDLGFAAQAMDELLGSDS